MRCWRGLWVLAIALTVTGCASFKPDLDVRSSVVRGAVNQTDERFNVSVAVPSSEQTAKLFDRRLEKQGIQPVWVSIENKLDTTAYFLPNLIDSDYFAPLEVAYQYHSGVRPGRNAAMQAFFLTNSMPDRLPPRSVRAGFVFTHLDLGKKQICVSIAPNPGAWHEDRYTFLLDVPGLKIDTSYHQWLSPSESTHTIECDENRLREELRKLPRATTDESGKREGDPLNLVIIGNEADLAAMAGCGWDVTERLTLKTGWLTFKSFLLGSHYRYSPVSSLYYAGRRQDVALQKARKSVNLRNHLRLWVTPLRFQGKPVWIGQISRDIGVRWTFKTANFTTHKINPNVDEARGYFIRDVVLGQAAKWWGFEQGAQAAPYHQPRHNLTGDPYFTDGLRAVIELSAKAVKPDEVQLKSWEMPPLQEFADEAHSTR